MALMTGDRSRDMSLPSFLQQRSEGRVSSTLFTNQLIRTRSRRSLLTVQKVVAHGTQIVASVDLSPEGRFLLAGRRDGSVLLYDLSRWGGQIEGDGKSFCHSPVAEAPRLTPRQTRSAVRLPVGHSAEVCSARWYPVDSGAFLTASTDGNLLVWDSQEMTTVIHYNPFQRRHSEMMSPHFGSSTGAKSIDSMEVSRRSCHSVAVASRSDSSIKLVDIRSGASSHSLLGHDEGGVMCLQWSPSSDYVLASGGRDGCLRLWDIRKAGSLSCITVLDQHFLPDMTLSRPCKPHYAHLRQRSKNANNTVKQLRKTTAPNDYRTAQTKQVTSSDRPILNLSFDPSGRYLASHDGTLALWDLRDGQGGFRAPRRFVTAQGSAHLVVQRKAVSDIPPRKPPLCVTDDGGDLTIWVAAESTLVAFSAAGGKPQQILRGHISPIQALTAAVDTNLLVSTGREGLILLWGHISRNGNNKRLREDVDNW